MPTLATLTSEQLREAYEHRVARLAQAGHQMEAIRLRQAWCRQEAEALEAITAAAEAMSSGGAATHA